MSCSIIATSMIALSSLFFFEAPFEIKHLTSERAEVRELAMAALITRTATLTEDDRDTLAKVVLDSSVSTEIRISAVEGIRNSVTVTFGKKQPAISESISNAMLRVVEDEMSNAELRSYCIGCLLLAANSTERGKNIENKVLALLRDGQADVIKRTILTLPRTQPLRKGSATYVKFVDALESPDVPQSVRSEMVESLFAMASVNLISEEDYGGAMASSLKSQASSDEFRRSVFVNEALLRLPRQNRIVPMWVVDALVYDFVHRNCSPAYMEYIIEELFTQNERYPEILSRSVDVALDKTFSLAVRRKALHILRSADVDDATVLDLLDRRDGTNKQVPEKN